MDFKLLVAGRNLNTSYYKDILKLIIAKGLKDKVVFVGHIDQSEMRTLISLSEAVITPSLYEPFGMINLQAAVMAKVVVSTDIVGSNNLLNRYGKMFIVKVNSAADLARAIERIDELQLNDDNFDFSGYSWFNVANKITDIFKKCSKLG